MPRRKTNTQKKTKNTQKRKEEERGEKMSTTMQPMSWEKTS